MKIKNSWIALALTAGSFLFFTCTNGNKSAANKENTLSAAMPIDSFEVSGNCEMCKERIETAAKQVPGVTAAIWDVDSKYLKFNHQANTAIDDVQKAVAKVGHDTKLYKADESTYNSLHDCCKYRK